VIAEAGLVTEQELLKFYYARKLHRLHERRGEACELNCPYCTSETAGKYAKDRLTREEVKKIDSLVAPILAKHAKHYTLAGSYRRGKQDIGDIDYVVTDCNLEDVGAEIQTRLKILEVSRQGQSVMTVVIKGKKKEAQVEFLNVKDDEYGAAMLHSTGSGEFNQGIRAFAKQKGLILNQHGLFIVANKKRLASAFEYQIFEELGLNPIPPDRRSDPWKALKKEFMKNPLKNIHTQNKPDLAGAKTWTVKSKSDPNKKYLVALKMENGFAPNVLPVNYVLDSDTVKCVQEHAGT
jgi:hypothetical protein